MQQALEALELLARYENPATKIQVRKPKDGGPIVTMYPHKVATDAAVPLRERLAQPEQEPVAFRNKETGEFCTGGFMQKEWPRWTPLYSAPPKRELTAYTCPAGLVTIGYGNTFYKNGNKVKIGDKITQQQAEELLMDLLPQYEAIVNKNIS